MNKQKIKEFLKPDKIKIILFILFLIIAYGGHTQAWAFGDKDELKNPKPMLYDFIQPFPFWGVWLFLQLPLLILSQIIVIAFGYGADFIMRGPVWLFVIIQIVYFYLLSCAVVRIFNKLKKK